MKSLSLAYILISWVLGAGGKSEPVFKSIADLDPTIVVEARYAGEHNFVGKPIRGYKAAKCLLSEPAAEALVKVQAELKTKNLGLKVYDCYRPQRAVNHFVEWAKDLKDSKMKKEFYPKVEKSTLFQDGYIASKSGHSRGSTLDLTIISLPAAEQETYKDGQPLKECFLDAKDRFKDNSIDMGTGYDCFDLKSNTANPTISAEAKKNRAILKAAMEKFNFRNYDKEWWHFTLSNEPYPDTFFDFEVK